MLDAKMSTLLAVAETLNYTKAAQALSLTQPAVSQHIRQLESEYGVLIFRRGEKPPALTDEGKILVEYARKLSNLHERMLQAIENERKRLSQLSVGVTPTSANSGMMQLLAQYAGRAHCAKVHVHTADGRTLQAMLRSYDLDLAIIEGSVSETDFYCVPIETDQLFIMVSPLNPLARKSVVTLEDLKQQKLILRDRSSGTRAVLENQIRQLFEVIDSFDVVMELDNVEAIKTLVKANFGVSILSERACEAELLAQELVMLPIENKRMVREVNLVCLPDAEHTATAQELARLYAKVRQQKRSKRR